tara:strand:+ start:1226 stop:1609 length:384 start_codon:yes stop_codon:yes gene_type:complete
MPAFLEDKRLSVAPCACGVLSLTSDFVFAHEKIRLPTFISVRVDLKVWGTTVVSVEPEILAGENLAKFADSGLVLDATCVTLSALAPAGSDRSDFRLCVPHAFLPIRLPFCDYGTHLQKLSAEKYTV